MGVCYVKSGEHVVPIHQREEAFGGSAEGSELEVIRTQHNPTTETKATENKKIAFSLFLKIKLPIGLPVEENSAQHKP